MVQENVSDWRTGRQIIDANGHHLITKANNNVDNNMKSYINQVNSKQLYKVP
jgi:hypothetical protein